MSTASLATPTTPSSQAMLQPVNPILNREVATASVPRRGTLQQGKALEILGHALDYLVDSRMFLVDEPATAADREAVQILAGLSRAVFAECAEVRSLRRRWRDWIIGRPPVAQRESSARSEPVSAR